MLIYYMIAFMFDVQFVLLLATYTAVRQRLYAATMVVFVFGFMPSVYILGEMIKMAIVMPRP